MTTQTRKNALEYTTMPLNQLITLADKTRAAHTGTDLQLCSILNARSGRCSEDCKFCAQSAHHNTNVTDYPLKAKSEIIQAAQQAKEIGSHRFGIVTSGNRLSGTEIQTITEAISEITTQLNIAVCGSLGAMTEDNLIKLKSAGMTRYHHNIETSSRFYPNIVTTHTFEDRIKTIQAAKKIGLQTCSGGIIGLGETWQDRIDMACTLKELNVDSVPINILMPIKGTPMASTPQLSPDDVIRTICIFRIILPDKIIKIAGGREAALQDKQLKGFMAGANGMIIGGYLTCKGAALTDDYALIEEIKSVWKE